MGKIISIVGLILIVSAGVLASISTSYEAQLKAKEQIAQKYIINAKEALKSGDKQKALKFIKMAIKVYPDNKEAFKLLEEIYASNNKTSTSTNKPAASQEEEEELGC